ncbi:MAG: DUF433 domain-containing protein, partial [Armatimonadota bacterium]|nr:DUF433 domain-containing protein [Armatimonadota bacterium]
TYKYLEARPHPWRKQLWVKGRNMTVWQLLCYMWANGFTPEEVAKGFDLPAEAVREAIEYYEQNKDLLEWEAMEEERRLREKGLLP